MKGSRVFKHARVPLYIIILVAKCFRILILFECSKTPGGVAFVGAGQTACWYLERFCFCACFLLSLFVMCIIPRANSISSCKLRLNFDQSNNNICLFPAFSLQMIF